MQSYLLIAQRRCEWLARKLGLINQSSKQAINQRFATYTNNMTSGLEHETEGLQNEKKIKTQ